MEIDNNFDKYITYNERNKDIKVAVAMSGGVDSSVVAYVLKKQGYDIFGVTMVTTDKIDEDAKKVCNDLGIPHHILDVRSEFDDQIINYFTKEFLSGRTPNPCMVCNKYMKFGKLLDFAKNLGAQYMATGHYAKIKDGVLQMGNDEKKDQVYFLSQVKRENLKCIMFPIGELEKPQVRELGEQLGVRVYDKRDSQDICFVGNGKLRDFLMERTKGMAHNPGPIKDKKGRIYGTHNGLAFYTIGQKKGLGLNLKVPRYVIGNDKDSNTLFISSNEELFSKSLIAEKINVLQYKNIDELAGVECFAKTRAKDNLHPCRIKVLDNDKLKVEFIEETVRAITPGQGVVLYNDNHEIIASGYIK